MIPDVNIHQNTSTEILHMILLEVVKYFWEQTIFIMKQDKSMDTFQTHLRLLSSSELKDPDLHTEYVCRYSRSLIGKHFKSLTQVMPFLVYDLMSSAVLDALMSLQLF